MEMKNAKLTFFITAFFISSLLACTCNHGHCSNNVCVCDENYEGSDCSIYNKEVYADSVVEDTITEYNWKYYNFQALPNQNVLHIKLEELSSGDIDVYLSYTAYPSYTNNFDYDDTTNSVVQMSVDLEQRMYYIGLYGFAQCTYRLTITVEVGCPNDCNGNGDCDLTTVTCNCYSPYSGTDCSIYNLEIESNVTYYGSAKTHEWIYYHLTITESINFSLLFTQLQSTSSLQIFAKNNEMPSFNNFDYANTTSNTVIQMDIQNINPGLWTIGIYAYNGGLYSIKVTLVHPPEPHCPNDCSMKGTCSSGVECTCDTGYSGDLCDTYSNIISFNEVYSGYALESYWNYWKVQYITSQSIKVHVTQLDGNCDVYIRPSSLPNRVAYQYSDSTTNDQIDLIIQYPSTIVWYVGVYGYTNCEYDIEFSFVDRCLCAEEGAHGECQSGSTYCECDLGWGGSGCNIESQLLQSLEIIHSTAVKNEMKYFYVQSNASALVITMIEKNTKGFVWLLVGTDGFPTLDNHDDINYGYAGEPSFHEIRYLWSSKRERIHYISVLGSSIDISPDPVEFAITVYATPF